MIFARRALPQALRAGAAPCRVAALLAVAGVLALSACSADGGGKSSGGNDTKFVAGTGEITSVKAVDRVAAPAISGKTTHGEELSLADYKGKVVVLNVWGSWCAPCRKEAPHLKEVADATKGEGVQFVGINTRDLDAANAQAFDRTYGIDYPSLFDPSGKLILEFPANSLPPQSIPSTLIIDREGRIAVRAIKSLNALELRKALDPIIAEK
ncbi:TlpA family protein disulfide reductase [Streptomyces polyrhachis]|uniref:TlpA family protein disulfide reductase n=1 Tax=Streptomyces polyrhachis TaxID=1282885 RepID=A0ABW2GLC9_9ACTN